MDTHLAQSITEPPPTAKTTSIPISLQILTPRLTVSIVACDGNKNRIGYGKGYYDKFLKDKNCIKIGLAYDFQVLKNITPNSWDIPLDYIITPTRIIEDIL